MKEKIINALKDIYDPDLEKDIVSLGFVKDIEISPEGKVSVSLELTTPACPFKKIMKEQAEKAIKNVQGVKEVNVIFTSKTSGSPASAQSFLPEVKNIVVVGSGKGGVGKSTVSVNLALALAQSGAMVGILDADVYGPSIPTLMKLQDHVEIQGSQDRMFPVIQYGVQVMSMGFFLPSKDAAIWRGPMLDKLITQFLTDVDWGSLDYLLIDLPPGTGDVQLGLCQKLALTGAIVVSTPQDVAMNIAQKAISMFQKLNCPILGIVENMSYYVCPDCGKKTNIFGEGAARSLSEKEGFVFLGDIPLASSISSGSDQGVPIVISEPESPQAKAFIAIAEKMTSQISIQNFLHSKK